MKIIKQREHVVREVRELCFWHIEFSRGRSGFAFEVDHNDEPILPTETLRASYQDCVDHPERYHVPEIRTRQERHVEFAEGECDVCQSTVLLQSGWSNTCEGCGTEYNGGGQRLAPRSQWGEETGERFV